MTLPSSNDQSTRALLPKVFAHGDANKTQRTLIEESRQRLVIREQELTSQANQLKESWQHLKQRKDDLGAWDATLKQREEILSQQREQLAEMSLTISKQGETAKLTSATLKE